MRKKHDCWFWLKLCKNADKGWYFALKWWFTVIDWKFEWSYGRYDW